jgi:hypothetical protein
VSKRDVLTTINTTSVELHWAAANQTEMLHISRLGFEAIVVSRLVHV